MKLRKILVAALTTLAFGMLVGCGSSNKGTAVVQVEETPIEASNVTVNTTTGTATIGAAVVEAKTADGVKAVEIPAGTVITAAAGSTMVATPAIRVSTPVDGKISGVTSPIGTTLSTSDGAVNVEIPGVDKFTTDNAITVNIPVVNVPANPAAVPVTVVKSDGSLAAPLVGTYDAVAKTVSVDATDFCWFIVNAKYVTGSETPHETR